MLNWIENELGIKIDLRIAFLETLGITATVIGIYFLLCALA